MTDIEGWLGGGTGVEQLANGGFEISGGSVPGATFESWINYAPDGAIADETTLVHSGSHAAKITAGPAHYSFVFQTIAVVPGATSVLTFWTRGDGTHAGRVFVYDNNNGAFIVDRVTTGVPGTTYTQVSVPFTSPALGGSPFKFACESVLVGMVCPSTNGGIAYFDNVSVRDNPPLDEFDLDGAGQVEIVGALAKGIANFSLVATSQAVQPIQVTQLLVQVEFAPTSALRTSQFLVMVDFCPYQVETVFKAQTSVM